MSRQRCTGMHRATQGKSWLQRPRQPFQVNGFTLRFVLIPAAFIPVFFLQGSKDLIENGSLTGLVEVVLALFAAGLVIAYLRRPVVVLKDKKRGFVRGVDESPRGQAES